MSDLAAQREARRRKITQNAQARMDRLLGRTSLADNDNQSSENETIQPAVVNPQLKDESPVQTQSLGQSPHYNLRRRSQKSDSPPPNSASADPSHPHLSEGLPMFPEKLSPDADKESNQPSTGSEERGHLETGQTEPNIEQPNTEPAAQTQDVQNGSTSATPADKSFDARSMEFMRIAACVVTALLSRFTLKFGFGLFMVQSIFLPFIGMEAVFVYIIETFLKDMPMVQSRSTLISAALMLCGIKPDLMDVYHKIMTHFTLVASDFGLYFFSFVVWHSIMT